MKQTIKHSRVERVTYEFDEWDIRRALLEAEDISEHKAGRRIEFDVDITSDSKIFATIAIVFETQDEDD